MTTTLIIMVPLLPGKQEAWRQFCQTLQGSRRHEYEGCLQRLGITKQEAWLSQTRHGDLVRIHLQVKQCEQMVTVLATSHHLFDSWLRKQLLELHGLDLKHCASSVQELILIWPPARIEDAASNEEKRYDNKERNT